MTAEAPTAGAPVGLGSALRRIYDNIRSGEVGALPVIVGLIIIVVFFQTKNENFVSAGNFNNLIVQMAGTVLVAMGVVFVLLIGEIDLSVGATSGLAAAVMAVLNVKNGWDPALAIVAGVATGAAIGLLQGMLFTRFRIPSFVVTLAGLLAKLVAGRVLDLQRDELEAGQRTAH